jgi:uncharacterized membrane protein
VGIKPETAGSVSIEQGIEAPAERVASYIRDFRNAKEWMVGIERVEKLDDERYRLALHTPIGKLEPEARVLQQGPHSISWVYTTALEGGGRVDVAPNSGGCVVTYTGEFRLKRRLLDRAARLIGVERFARKNGERSLSRLKYLMEAHRYR